VFISLEGVDGSGKSTQAKLLAAALGPETVAIREPGGTDAAERIRGLLADPELVLEPLAELMLFCAARADLTEQVIRPALEAGRAVVCDRFSDSSVAYQGAARGLGVGEVISLCDTATAPRAATASRPRALACSRRSPPPTRRSRSSPPTGW
jgi:dTMP kinase